MMKYEAWFLAATIVLGPCLVPAWGEPAASAAEHAERMLVAGLLAHDRGPMSDRHENGIDLNLEMQFAPLAVFASPRPHLGISANFNGDTSTLYAGINFRLLQRQQWHVDGILGIAVHDGPLHKDPVGCELDSDCGYGVRYLPRFGAELGYRLTPVGTLSLYYVHMSHKWIIEGENEGLDLIGLRYGRPF